MGYKFWCERCGHNYYTVGGNTWYTSGSVTVYPKYGYGGCCVPGKSLSTFTYRGNVVKLECRGCTNKFGIVTWYDWKNKSGESTGYCNGCRAHYKNEQERRKARERVARQERDEAQRLERIARQRREAAIKQRQREREAKIKKQKKAAEEAKKKRDEEVQDLMTKLRDNTGSNPSEDVPNPTPPENKDVYDNWIELDTLEIIQDIGDRVAECSAAGQDLVDNVTTIAESLKESLKDHYSTIEPEVKRYEEYGKEMKDMNNVFVKEFEKVFKSDCVENIAKVWNTCNKKEKDDVEEKKEYDGINWNDPEEAMKQFQDLLNKKKKRKEDFDANMKNMMSALDKAINNMTSKLDVMEKYYDDMIKDNVKFIQFCKEQGNHYGKEMKDIKEYLEEIGAKIRPRRDLYEGHDEEKRDFTVEYEVDVPVSEPSGDDDYKGYQNNNLGVEVCAAAGAGYGFFGGAGVGLVAGAIIGGMLGRFLSMQEKDEESGRELVSKTEKVTLTGKDYYDGTEQKQALQKIIGALENEVKGYKEKLKKSQNDAKENEKKAQDFKSSIKSMRQQVNEFKNEVNHFQQKLSGANKNETFMNTMESKCTDLIHKIWSIVREIEIKSES